MRFTTGLRWWLMVCLSGLCLVKMGLPAFAAKPSRTDTRQHSSDLSVRDGGKSSSYRLAILNDDIPTLNPDLVHVLSRAIVKAGIAVTSVGCDQLANPEAFNVQRFDCLMLTDSPHFPIAAEQNLLKFIGAGGDLVLMGGQAFDQPLWKYEGRWLSRTKLQSLPQSAVRPQGFSPDKEIAFYGAFEDYEVYRLQDVTAIEPAARQPWSPWQFTLTGQFEGVSAVGFGFPNESRFVPFLSAVDRHGRVRGWAAGVHVNYGGPFKNSQVGLCSASRLPHSTAVRSLFCVLVGYLDPLQNQRVCAMGRGGKQECLGTRRGRKSDCYPRRSISTDPSGDSSTPMAGRFHDRLQLYRQSAMQVQRRITPRKSRPIFNACSGPASI